MFDMFGSTAPVPTPELELSGDDVSIKEKAGWEKELLGVSLSKQPFISHSKDPGVILCGQINEEMVGQSVTVIAEVSMATTSFTREHKTFATVTLEDISGRIEVMVWPRIYERTTDLWQEGNILEVKGKIRLRDERLQFTCDDARMYQAEPVQTEETPQPAIPEKETGA